MGNYVPLIGWAALEEVIWPQLHKALQITENRTQEAITQQAGINYTDIFSNFKE